MRGRDSILAALSAEVVAPALQDVAWRSQELRRAAERLVTAPAEPELKVLRACWQRAALAWKRASAFRAGAPSSREAVLRATYWPARSAAIREVLRDERAPSAARLAELGADVKGLYALEYVLFDVAGEPHAWQRLSGPLGAGARAWVLGYAQDLHACAVQALADVSRGTSDSAARFAQTGAEALARWVSGLAESVEGALVARLQLVAWLVSLQRLRPIDVEGGPSGSAQALLGAVLAGSQRLYSGGAGGGLAELVVRAAPAVHARVASAFEAATSALRALPSPLETAVLAQRARVESALAAAKSLEVALKTDVPSALGVSVAFSSFDAD